MGKKDLEYIGHLEHQLKLRDAAIEQMSATINHLETELYKARLRQTASQAGIEAVIEQAADDREQFRGQAEAYQKAFYDFAPTDAIFIPLYTADQRPKLLAEGRQEWLISDVSLVAASIVIRYGTDPDDYISSKITAVYPGAPENAYKDILPRLAGLMRRAPIVEDLRRAGLIGISDDKLLGVTLHLSDFFSLKKSSDARDKEMRRMFKEYLWADIEDGSLTEAEAYNRFSKTIKRSFEQVFERRAKAIALKKS